VIQPLSGSRGEVRPAEIGRSRTLPSGDHLIIVDAAMSSEPDCVATSVFLLSFPSKVRVSLPDDLSRPASDRRLGEAVAHRTLNELGN
jgi:hypothetical protein